MKRITIALALIFIFPAAHGQQDFINRLIEIKYSSEVYISNAIKKSDATHTTELNNSVRDSAQAVYNTLRYKIDGLIYGLSTDMITVNSPRRLRLLNAWCLQQPVLIQSTMQSNQVIKNGVAHIAPKQCIYVYTNQLQEIENIYKEQILLPNTEKEKTINLSTNVFYLLKDSYTIIQGLSDMKTKKTMALVELLDHIRLLGPGEIAKLGK
jgi:hypothetical protein